MTARSVRRAIAGATGVSLLVVPAAHAADFTVTQLTDGPADACDSNCTLRDAITAANGNGEADTIGFSTGLTGTIALTQGNQLAITENQDLTITGPGAGALTVSGDVDANGLDAGDVRVFDIGTANTTAISGLTITDGGGTTDGSTTGDGGAIRVTNGIVQLTDAVVSDSTAAGIGGGISALGGSTRITLTRTRVTGNEAAGQGGGVGTGSQAQLTVSGGAISDNESTGAFGGGVGSANGSVITISSATISGNTASGQGGGISLTSKYGELTLTDSVVTGNTGANGGGLALTGMGGKYGQLDHQISTTTVSGNTATGQGGGLLVDVGDSDDTTTVNRSTVSGNTAAGSGGGIKVDPGLGGDARLVDSTVSGNTSSASGGGIAIGDDGSRTSYGGTLSLENSTIATNKATTSGGGVFLTSYDDGSGTSTNTSATIPVISTIVADNTVGGAPQDLDRTDGSTGGGFDLGYALVEAKGDAPLFQSAGENSIVGVDPQLGPLANNGGPTQTQLPSQASPVVDKGDAPLHLLVEQRGTARTIDSQAANAPGGDATDIGAVETARPADPPAQPPATDTSAPRTETVILTRSKPTAMSARVSPGRDRKAPFRFTTRGALTPPSMLTKAQACGGGIGYVVVQFKRAGNTISTRLAPLAADCTYTSRVTFRSRKAFGKQRSLKVYVRFLGNNVLEPVIRKNPVTVRVR